MEKQNKNKKLKVTSIRISEELCSQIDKLAEINNRTRNEEINYILKSWIEIKNK